jgi:hypothetical protein
MGVGDRLEAGRMGGVRGGRARLLFDFLAWYRPIVAYRASQTEPTLAELAAPRAWSFQQSGTLTTRHYANLQLKSVGRIDIDEARLTISFLTEPFRSDP